MNIFRTGRQSTYAKAGLLDFLRLSVFPLFLGIVLLSFVSQAQQPVQPVDSSPLDGESYYIINQLSGLQMDLDNASSASGAAILLQDRNFTTLSQRWAMTRLPAGGWVIANLANGLCLDSATSGGSTSTVQNPCSPTTATQQWLLSATSNGYNTLANVGTGLDLDVFSGSSSSGAALNQTAASTSPTQSQQWLLRPVFMRGVDNAMLEKQEADRVSASLPWWTDAGQSQDVLQILKNHGVNMVRIRPTSVPPYQTYSLSSPLSALPSVCSANGCYAETDSADLDLAKRAKQLGLSVELTLFFDGGSSTALPGAWSGYTLAQAQAAVYSYVKTELEAYRSAGVMPDMVTIGNEVDTGFFGSLASPSGSNFTPFASLQIQGMQAVLDAASDTSIGPAIPPPLRCIHITPGWDLTNFFNLVNSNNIPYDAICQSYYPIYHGPLTAAQAAASNPNNKPIEQSVLTTAANSIGKPIFLIEVGEHYENGFDSNDPWYPATIAGQRQFLVDVNAVLKGLPQNLGMGMDYWDASGVNTTAAGGGYTNGDGAPNSTFVWNGLTLFDNADTSGSSQSTLANYSAILGGADALGGKIDSALAYKLVNVASGSILGISGPATSSGTPLSTAASNGSAALFQQWSITSNGDGYLQIANLSVPQGSTTLVLDNGGSGTSGAAIVLNSAASGTASQEWNLLTAADGHYTIVNKTSGLVLADAGGGAIQQQSPASTSLDWITPASQSQLWKVIPAHITAADAPAQLSFSATTPTSTTYGLSLGTVSVNVDDSNGLLVDSPSESVTLAISGPGGFSYSASAASVDGEASFDLSSLALGAAGSYTLTASSAGIVAATATLNLLPATLAVTAQNASRVYGAANPAFTYAITGFVNGDSQAVVTGAPVFFTSAVATSAPGSYPVTVAAGTLSALNYTFVLAPGTLTVTKDATSTKLTSAAATVNPGQSVTLSATVSSTTPIVPAGTVNFLSGTTQLGSATLAASGVATYIGPINPGSNVITAAYVGNADFVSSTSIAVDVQEPDYSMAANQTAVTITAGGNSNVSLTITPVGSYNGTVTMSCTTPMAGVSCSFTPATYTLDGSDSVLTGSVTVAASSTAAALHPLSDPRPPRTVEASVFWLPAGISLLLLSFRRRRFMCTLRARQMLLLFALLAAAFGISACGSGGANGGGGGTPQSVTGVVTITAAGSTGNLSPSLQLTVTVN